MWWSDGKSKRGGEWGERVESVFNWLKDTKKELHRELCILVVLSGELVSCRGAEPPHGPAVCCDWSDPGAGVGEHATICSKLLGQSAIYTALLLLLY